MSKKILKVATLGLVGSKVLGGKKKAPAPADGPKIMPLADDDKVMAARRASITINGEATVELDYSSCHPRLLYHSLGCELEGDAYAIPEIMEAAENDGMDWAEVRRVVKAVFGHMLNSTKPF